MATQPLKDLMQAMSIEDVYPCTPAQRGILLSQPRNHRRYNTLWTIEVSPIHGHAAVNLQKLQVAWAQVVSRHAALRTILVSFPDTEFAQQVVIKDFEPSVSIITDGTVNAMSRAQELTDQREPDSWTPTPQVAILQQAGGSVRIGLSISHAFFDATSIELLMRDLRLVYDGQLSLENPPRFKDFVDHVQAETSAAARALQYWTDYLRGIEPCHLLSGLDSDYGNPSVRTVSIDLVDSNTLQSFCSEQGLLVTNILHVAWALVLRCYTGMNGICFS